MTDEAVELSGFVVKSVEIIPARSSLLTDDGHFPELPTMFVRCHYQDGDVGEMLFDPAGVTILLEAVMTYLETFEPEERERFDEYVTVMSGKVQRTVESMEEE